MSTLSKICIVLLALLSVGMMVVVVSMATVVPNYRKAYEREKQENEISLQSYQAARVRAQHATDSLDQLRNQYADAQNDFDATTRRLADDLATEKQALLMARGAIAKINSSLADLKRTIKDQNDHLAAANTRLDNLREQYNRTLGDKEQLTGQLESAMAEVEQYQKLYKAQRADLFEISRQLDEKSEQAARLLIQLGSGAVNPEVTTVKDLVGTVTAVRDDIASINIGSAKGVQAGMKLMIARGGDFVGYLRVEDVDLHRAVGFIVDPQQPARSGDKVFSE